MPNGKKTTADVPFDEKRHGGGQHHVGFNDALEKALDQLSGDVRTGTYAVTVQFEAGVEVTNPGAINFYRVTLAD